MEFAIVGSLLLMLVLGVLEFGLVFNDYLAVRYGSQDAARQGAVGTTGSTASCGITGPAAGANTPTKQLVCLTKNRVGLGDAKTRVKLVFGSGGYVEQGRMVLCVQHPFESRTQFFDPIIGSHFIQARTPIRIEDLASSGPLQATEETAPAGGNWSWCSAP